MRWRHVTKGKRTMRVIRCDGCDNDIKGERAHTVKFSEFASSVAIANSLLERDLCGTCLDKWRERADPIKWGRYAPDEAPAEKVSREA